MVSKNTKQYNVIIAGAGAVGCACARELSARGISVCVLEKEADAAFGISGRNSGVLHCGINSAPGSLMARLCVEGCENFDAEVSDLGIDFRRTGKYIIALSPEDIPALEALLAQGESNGVRGLQMISGRELGKKLHGARAAAAIHASMTGIFDPFRYTIALAEKARSRGTDFFFGHRVTDVIRCLHDPSSEHETGRFTVKTISPSGCRRDFSCDFFINSGGLCAGEICRMAGIEDYTVHPCRGEYHILDRETPLDLPLPVYPVPGKRSGGLGVHLTPSLSGNIMIGPSAEYLQEDDPDQDDLPFGENYSTTGSVMEKLFIEGRQLLAGMYGEDSSSDPLISRKDIIRSFSGVRPKLTSEKEGGFADFVIEDRDGFIILAGIESPGLTASVPIARRVSGMISGSGVSGRVRHDVPGGEAGTARIICRCESVTEKDILDAYDRILWLGGIPTLKGLKNRVRAGMGSCQGCFCTVNIIDLLEKKRGIDPLVFCQDRLPGSKLFAGRVRR